MGVFFQLIPRCLDHLQYYCSFQILVLFELVSVCSTAACLHSSFRKSISFQDTLQSSCHFRAPISHSRIISYHLAHCCFCQDYLKFPYYFKRALLTLIQSVPLRSCHFQALIGHWRISSAVSLFYDHLDIAFPQPHSHSNSTVLTMIQSNLQSSCHFQAPISHQRTSSFQISLYLVVFDLVFLEVLIFLLLQSPYHLQAPIIHLRTILLQVIFCLLSVDFLGVYYYFQKALLTVTQYPPLSSYHFQAPISHLRKVSFQLDNLYSVVFNQLFLEALIILTP